jgi:hypothetical protein
MTASIMAYVPGAIPQMADGVIIPDWRNNRLYSIGSGNVGNPPPQGISQFTGYVSGDLTLTKTIAQLGLADISASPAVLTYSGLIVVPEGFSGRMAAIRAADLTVQNLRASMPQPGTLAAARYKGRDYVFGCPGYSIPDYPDIYVMGALELVATKIGTMTEGGHPMLCTGSLTDNVHVAYALGQGAAPTDPTNPNRYGLYSIQASIVGFTVVPISHGVPSTIDATWTTFNAVYGLAYDQTDGNLLAAFDTNDAVANKSYLVKFNSTTGAVMWKLAISNVFAFSPLSLQAMQIKNGRLHFWMPPPALGADLDYFLVNTLTGAVVTQTSVSHMKSLGAQISEDTNNSIVANATWNESGTVPNYIGTYMGTLGHHTYGGWMRWFPSVPTAPLPPAPPPVPSNPPIVSVNRAWSYTLDGHTFYVLDLGAQGTFVYDQLTNQWSQFVTGAPATNGGNNLQWNFQNGCMWGTRIVGGDLAVSTVWEMAPAAVLDNDATQIAHVCTGAVPARSRTYITCDALRVSASFGLLDSSGAVNFNLRFSDDQEATWSTYYTVALTPGNYGGEIAWRSLGAFASPGRIFELSDSGGLIRIDGADVYLDGFDDKPAGAGGG